MTFFNNSYILHNHFFITIKFYNKLKKMNLKTLKTTENNQKQQEYCIFTLLKTQKKNNSKIIS